MESTTEDNLKGGEIYLKRVINISNSTHCPTVTQKATKTLYSDRREHFYHKTLRLEKSHLAWNQLL